MTTVPQTRTDLLAARKAAAGLPHLVAGYTGEVADAGVTDAVGAAAGADAEGADAGLAAAAGDVPAAGSGNLAPISWHTSLRFRNLVASVVMPAA